MTPRLTAQEVAAVRDRARQLNLLAIPNPLLGDLNTALAYADRLGTELAVVTEERDIAIDERDDALHRLDRHLETCPETAP